MGDDMGSEKEINVYLLNELDLIEDATEVAKERDPEKMLEFLEKRKKQIERKLYQKPPMTSE